MFDRRAMCQLTERPTNDTDSWHIWDLTQGGTLPLRSSIAHSDTAHRFRWCRLRRNAFATAGQTDVRLWDLTRIQSSSVAALKPDGTATGVPIGSAFVSSVAEKSSAGRAHPVSNLAWLGGAPTPTCIFARTTGVQFWSLAM